MRFFPAISRGILLAFLPLSILTFAVSAADWKPVTAAELNLKTPLVEKDADAEALFWNVQVSDELKGSDFEATQVHYLRIKIFNERGRERAKQEIVYGRKTAVSSLAGRTVKPDGSSIDMKKDAVFDREVIKGRGIKFRAKSFTLPDVQPGDIIEYQWQETESDAVSNYLRLPLQRDIPIQLVRYDVKPLSLDYSPYHMRTMTFHAEPKQFQAGGTKGFSSVEYRNIPAFHEEPWMPPSDEMRAWILIFYAPDSDAEPDKYWPKYGRAQFARYKELIKVNGDIKKVAAEVTSGASSEEQKIQALYAWTRKNVRNVGGTDTTAAERTAWKPNRGAGDTMKQRLGTGFDINILFATLATSVGLDARVALTGNRGDFFFDPRLANSYFLGGEDIAIKTGGQWKLYDPASFHGPCGLVSWREQGMKALITDAKDPVWFDVAITPAAQSQERHKARLTLALDGSISGTVEMAWTGHTATAERARLYPMKAEERDQSLIDDMKRNFAEPEVTGIHWSNVDNPEKELSVSFELKVPDYVQRTGRRMFLQPALFQRADAARFPSATRKMPIFFEHPWNEIDDIVFELPQGFSLDHPDVPAPIDVQKVFRYKVAAKVSNGSPAVLTYSREFALDGTTFALDAYPSMKKLFDTLRDGDQHSFSLLQSAAPEKGSGQ